MRGEDERMCQWKRSYLRPWLGNAGAMWEGLFEKLWRPGGSFYMWMLLKYLSATVGVHFWHFFPQD